MEMESLPFEVVAPAGQTLGESASWCGRTQMLGPTAQSCSLMRRAG